MEHNIWQSRKFWITVVDVVVSLTAYFVGKYLSPEASKDIMTLVLSLQPVVLLLIGSYAVQNIAGIKANASVDEAIVYNEGREVETKLAINAQKDAVAMAQTGTGSEPE